jgi:hypothetical protein
VIHAPGNGDQQKAEWVENSLGLFGVSKPIIAIKELCWNRRRLIRIQFSGHTGTDFFTAEVLTGAGW